MTHPMSTTTERRLLHHGPVRPTPAGAYRVVARPGTDPTTRLLLSLLRERETPVLSEGALCSWVGTDDLGYALDVLAEAQDLGLIEGIETTLWLPDDQLDQLVPPLLADLSDEGRALLADAEGLAAWHHGFADDEIAPVAALSADLATLHGRHTRTLVGILDGDDGAWALVDGNGASRLGCWPLHIGATRFSLIAQGIPRLHHESFTALVWLLVSRYG